MDANFWYNILTTVLEALVPVAISVIGVLILNFAKKHGASTEAVQLISSAYEILARAARNTNQIYVDALKKANGTLTAEEMETARQKTTETFKTMITEATKLAIEEAYGSVESWIGLNLESAVNEVKDYTATAE